MMMIFSFVLLLISNVAVDAAQKPLAGIQDRKEMVQEACPCVDCNPWWIPNFLISAQPHPLSPAEESAAQALYDLPLACVSSGNRSVPLIDLILEWVGEEDNRVWLAIANYKNVVRLILNRCVCPQVLPRWNSYTTGSHFYKITPVFSKNVVFDDGKCQGYAAVCVDNDNYVGMDSNGRGHLAHDVKAKKIQKTSQCNKFRITMHNNGELAYDRQRALTVITEYCLYPWKRIRDRLKSIECKS